jgi:hypothetical protein
MKILLSNFYGAKNILIARTPMPLEGDKFQPQNIPNNFFIPII